MQSSYYNQPVVFQTFPQKKFVKEPVSLPLNRKMSVVIKLNPGPRGLGMTKVAELCPSDFQKSEMVMEGLRKKKKMVQICDR